MSGPSASQERPIFLVGMMGAGKSTIGPRLAERLGRAFADTDHAVEARAGRSIPEIFERDGEAAFRRLEAEAIDEAAASGAVVALGGGAIAQPGAADRLLDVGEVVWLCVPPEVLVDRIGEGDDRPLLAGLDRAGRRARLEALLAERRPHYERADHRVDATGRTEDVVAAIEAALEGAGARPEGGARAGRAKAEARAGAGRVER